MDTFPTIQKIYSITDEEHEDNLWNLFENNGISHLYRRGMTLWEALSMINAVHDEKAALAKTEATYVGEWKVVTKH